MKRFSNILLAAALVSLFLNNELQAAHIPPTDVEQQQQHEHRHNSPNVDIIKDIKVFMMQNPHLRLIRLNKYRASNQKSQLVNYTLGNRVKGDRLVAQYGNTFYYSSLEDVSEEVTYPGKNSTGSIVTHVDIHCLQDNADGNAYVVAGGIDQRFISIVLEAIQTKRFTYNVHIFGTN